MLESLVWERYKGCRESERVNKVWMERIDGAREGHIMSETLKKIVDFGLETQTRLADFLSDFLNKVRMDEEERKQFVADLGEKLERNRERGEKLVKDLVDKMPSPMIFAKQRELEELKQKVEEMEERVKALEARIS
jgi:polyhydroxyalkanoate synthesis regulator phasin